MEGKFNPETYSSEHKEVSSYPEKRKFAGLTNLAEIMVRNMTGEFKVNGTEYIPKDEALVIANHSSHIDGWALLAALKGYNAGVIQRYAELNRLTQLFYKKIGVVGIKEVATNIPEADKEWLKNTSPHMAEIMARENDPDMRREDQTYNIRTLKEIVENLSKGRKMVYFPEGGFYRADNTELRPTTNGAEAIARLYHRKTGKELLILPAGINGGASVMGATPEDFSFRGNTLKALKEKTGKLTVNFGQPFHLDKNESFDQEFIRHVSPLIT